MRRQKRSVYELLNRKNNSTKPPKSSVSPLTLCHGPGCFQVIDLGTEEAWRGWIDVDASTPFGVSTWRLVHVGSVYLGLEAEAVRFFFGVVDDVVPCLRVIPKWSDK